MQEPLFAAALDLEFNTMTAKLFGLILVTAT